MVKKLSSELLDILACPVCKGSLLYKKDKNQLICKRCKEKYEVKDGIPILLPPELK